MKRRKYLARSTKPLRKSYITRKPKRAATPRQQAAAKRKRAKDRQRKATTFARAFGSTHRVAFVKSLPCVVVTPSFACPRRDIQNHHITTDGTARRAAADQIIPLCGLHHASLHAKGQRTFAALYSLDLTRAAAETQARYLTHCQEQKGS